MEAKIEAQLKNRGKDEITELNLDNCKCSEFAGLTDEFVSLTSLSLVGAGLTSLKGFPKLPNLKKLDLTDNKISGGLDLLQCPKLIMLNLSGNPIKEISTLQPLENLENLRAVDLLNCDVTNVEDYREKMFDMLDSLESLDGFDRDEQEAEIIDGEDSSDLDEEDEEDDEVGLAYLQKSGLEDESDGEDFAPGDEDGNEEEDDYDDDEENDYDEEEAHGTKRKHEDDEDEGEK